MLFWLLNPSEPQIPCVMNEVPHQWHRAPQGKLNLEQHLSKSFCCHSPLNQHVLLASFTVVLVVVFSICWAPFHTDRLMWSFISDWTDSHQEIFQYVHVISGVFFYLSSAVNPILYNLMSTRFREMFKEVMCHRPHHITARKHSLSMTRVTLRSTLSDVPLNYGLTVVEADAENKEERVKDEISFTV